MPHVLVVEGHDAVNRLLCQILVREGYRCSSASTVADAEALLARERIDLLVCEAAFPDGGSGLTLVELAEAQGARAIVVTARAVALPAGVPLLMKPFNVNRLVAVVRDQLATGVGTRH